MTFKEKTFELIGRNELIFKDLNIYANLIEKKNKLLNLTGFTGDLLWKEGIYQSLVLMIESFNNVNGKKMLDIGSGVGFPSVPFLIFKRNFFLYISEPIKKRILFLEQVKKELQLNIIFIDQRIEEYSNTIKFDLITARAVTSLKKLIEISSKIGAINSQYSFLKGPKIYDELSESNWIINELSITPYIHKVNIVLDSNTTQTHYLFKYIKKIITPSKFPRAWSLIIDK